MKYAYLRVTCLFLCGSALIFGQPSGVERVASVEGVTEYKLKNGLRAVLFPDPAKPTITVNITYLVGSRHENYGETGMAHILEHLMSYGSTNHPDAKLEQSSRGAARNASTWYDRTNYYETFPASDENLQWALDLESDRMVNALVKKEILQSQMSVVRNEFERGENSPSDVLLERVFSTAFLWHNYGKSTIGARSDIENVPIERLTEFYKTYYRPDNAVLIVSGKFDEAKAVEWIAKYFGLIQRPSTPTPPTYTEEPTQDGERTVMLRRVGDVQEVSVFYHAPGLAHPDSAAMQVLSSILTTSPGGRLHKALIETKKATDTDVFHARLLETGGLYLAAAVRKDASLDAARDALLGTIHGFDKTPVTKEEVARAQAQILKQFSLDLNDPQTLATNLSGSVASGDWRLLFINRDRVKKVTPEDVQRVALAYLKPSNRTLGLFIPEEKPDRAEIPRIPDIPTLVKDYKGDQLVSQGEAFDPTPENIDRRTVTADLPSGMKLAFLTKKNRGGTVVATLRLRFGDEKSLQGKTTDAEFVRQMLLRGSKSKTRQQIQDEFDRLKARVNVNGGPGNTEISMETVESSVPELLKLVAELVKQPSFPESEFEQLRQQTLSRGESLRSEPQALAMNARDRHLNPFFAGDPRYVATIDERIALAKAATIESVKSFHAQFYGTSDAILTVVGGVNPKEVQSLAAELFGNWKSPQRYAEIHKPFQSVETAARSIETPDKANAFFTAGMPVKISDEDRDYPALVLGNFMLGGTSTSRLYLRIRGKEGLSYAVGSGLNAPPGEQRAEWTANAICAPQNASRVEAAFREEVLKATTELFTAEELKAGKSGWLQSQRVLRSRDQFLSTKLATNRQEGRTMAFDAALEQKMAALTAEDVKAALAKYLDPEKISIIKAGDFRKAVGGAGTPSVQ